MGFALNSTRVFLVSRGCDCEGCLGIIYNILLLTWTGCLFAAVNCLSMRQSFGPDVVNLYRPLIRVCRTVINP